MALVEKLWRPAIEFNVTEHCNLRCEHCDHASPLMSEKLADLERFTHDLEALSVVLHAGEMKFVGGEPLLHPQLLEFLRTAKKIQIAERLILVTNGVLLHKAPEELWQLIDGMWISIYPGVRYRFSWEWVQQMADEHNLFVWRKETPSFVESSLIKEIKSKSLVRMIYQNCDRAHLFSCHTIFEGRYYVCEPAIWMEPRLTLHGISFANRDADSVSIHDNPRLYEDLNALIRRQEPLEACRYCLGSWARATPNIQLSRSRIKDFLVREQDDVSELINPSWLVPKSYKQET